MWNLSFWVCVLSMYMFIRVLGLQSPERLYLGLGSLLVICKLWEEWMLANVYLSCGNGSNIDEIILSFWHWQCFNIYMTIGLLLLEISILIPYQTITHLKWDLLASHFVRTKTLLHQTVCISIHTHMNPWGRLKWLSAITWLTRAPHSVWHGVWSGDLWVGNVSCHIWHWMSLLKPAISKHQWISNPLVKAVRW